MGLLKIRDERGVVREVVALKGEPGGFSPHTHPVEEVTYDGGTVDKWLGELGEQLDDHTHGLADIEYHGDEYDSAYDYVVSISETADEALGHALDNKNKLSEVETLTDELNDGFVRLEDETIPSISETAITAQQYAMEAQEAAQTAQNDAVEAQRKADDVAEQIGGIEAALDGIINIQNILIGGGA